MSMEIMWNNCFHWIHTSFSFLFFSLFIFPLMSFCVGQASDKSSHVSVVLLFIICLPTYVFTLNWISFTILIMSLFIHFTWLKHVSIFVNKLISLEWWHLVFRKFVVMWCHVWVLCNAVSLHFTTHQYCYHVDVCGWSVVNKRFLNIVRI